MRTFKLYSQKYKSAFKEYLHFECRAVMACLLFTIFFCGIISSVNMYAAKQDNLSCSILYGENIEEQNYETWYHTINSYLVPIDTGFMRIQGNTDEGIVVSYYSSNYKLSKRIVIPEELPIFGGFYFDGSFNYIVTGQLNKEENDNIEVYRITKYDTNWKKIGSCGLYGANTIEPFGAGTCRMDSEGKYLVIRTCHGMYKIDGISHQANVTIMVDTSSMTIADSYTIVMNMSVGYVSHSFNQFVKIEDHHIVSIDHGDALPRSIVLMKYKSDITSGKFESETENTDVMKFLGDGNGTGASVGAFYITKDNYLIAGNSVVQDAQNIKHKTRNIFFALVDKTNQKVTIKWITDYSEGESTVSTPHMVQISEDKYMLLWSRENHVCYTMVDAKGNKLTDIFSFEGYLSDCVPVIANDKVVWYTWDDGLEKFYEIDLSNFQKSSIITLDLNHKYDIVSSDGNTATLKCSKCKKVVTDKIPSEAIGFWKRKIDDGPLSTGTPEILNKGDVIEYIIGRGTFEDGDIKEFGDIVIECRNDVENFVWDEYNRRIVFTEGGVYTVLVYPKYNPEKISKYVFSVEPIPVHDYQIVSSKKNKTVLKCKDCGKTITGDVPKEVVPFWLKDGEEGWFSTGIPQDLQKGDAVRFLIGKGDYEEGDELEFSKVVIESDDPKHCTVDWDEQKVTFTKAGKYNLKVYLKYNPDISQTCCFEIKPLSNDKSSDKTDNTSVNTVTNSDGSKTITTFSVSKKSISIKIENISVDGKTDIYELSGSKRTDMKLVSYSTYKNKVTIPKYVKINGKKYYITSIASKAFKNMKQLKKINLSASNIVSIAKKAFTGINTKAKFVLTGTENQCGKMKQMILDSGVGKKNNFIYVLKE